MQYHSPLFFGNLLSEEGPKQTTRPPQVLASSGLQNRIEKRNLPPTNLTTFVAQRVHRVCWFNGIGPVASGSTRNSPSKLFATGTAGDTTNLITLWASSSSLEQLRDPDVVCVASHVGDCTALQFLPADKVALVSGSSEGSVNLFEAPELQILSDSQGDSELQQTCQLYHHKQGTAVNAVAQHPQRLEVASAGEDGHIILSSFEKESTLRDLVVGGGGGVNALSFISMNTIAAVNTANQLQLWDLGRENINRPAAIFRDASSFNSLYSLGVHPTQPDYVVVGAMDGRTTVWDLRNNRAPVFSSLSHSSCGKDLAILQWHDMYYSLAGFLSPNLAEAHIELLFGWLCVHVELRQLQQDPSHQLRQ